MGEIEDMEVENLGRALASHHGRCWATMPLERQREADPNCTRKTWLGRARVILEAIDNAMILEIKRELAKLSGSEQPQSFEPQPNEERKRDGARHRSQETKGQAREGLGSGRLRLIHKSDTLNVSTARQRAARPGVPLIGKDIQRGACQLDQGGRSRHSEEGNPDKSAVQQPAPEPLPPKPDDAKGKRPSQETQHAP
jgi:hypothetical protein